MEVGEDSMKMRIKMKSNYSGRSAFICNAAPYEVVRQWLNVVG